MNYRHSYHAGSFSDVLKHIVLITLIRAMRRKEKPLCYLDTHAGRGLYHLNSEAANKTHESVMGIHKLFDFYHKAINTDAKVVPEIIKTYINTVENLGYPNDYPGSPFIAKASLREIDRLILMELHPEEHKILKKNVSPDNRIAVHHQNGYLSLKAFLPPRERRGLILIDPPFEKSEEWQQLLAAIKVGLKQFPTGVFAVWYPIKDLRQVKQFLAAISTLGVDSAIVAELGIYPQDTPLGLISSGMLMINPPWQCKEALEAVLPWIWKALAVNEAGGWRLEAFKDRSLT